MMKRLAIMALVLAGFVHVARADAIRIGAYWYEPVRIEMVREGQLVYVNEAGTRLTAALPRVTGLKMAAHPALARAETALAEGDPTAARAALTELTRIDSANVPPWLRDWATWRQMNLAAETGHARETVRFLVALAANRADPAYFQTVPTDVVRGLEPNLVRDLKKQLTGALRQAEGEARTALAAMLDAVRGGPSKNVSPKVQAPARAAIALSRAMPADDPVAALLHAGDYAQALNRLTEKNSFNEREAPLRLYQRGIAQLALTQQANDLRLYKTAGLDFMRVLIHYPHSAYRGPALIEAGFIHQRLNRPEIAGRLFEQARLFIDDAAEPELAERLRQLTATVKE